MRGCFGPNFVWIYEVKIAADDSIVDRILHKSARIRDVPEPGQIGVIFGKEKFLGLFAIKIVGAERIMRGLDQSGYSFLEIRFPIVSTPAPGIAKPDRWQDVQRRGLRTTICRGDPDEN